MKTLVLIGTSGSGKTVLKNSLLNDYSKVFNNVEQVSTRAPRGPDDTSYDFIDVEKYKEIEDTLTCKTDFNGNFYGSKMKKFQKRKINILVADKTGFTDFITSEFASTQDVIVLTLDRYDYQGIADIRDDRDTNFLMSEHATVIQIAQERNTYYHDVTTNGFINPEVVYDLCQNVLNGVTSAEVKVSKYRPEGDNSAF